MPVAATSSQSFAARRTTSGEIEFAGGRSSHAIATSPRDLELDRALLPAGVRPRVREEALAGLDTEPALGDEPAQDRGGSKLSPHSLAACSSRASSSSRPIWSARANGGGMMPAPAIIPRSISRIERDALLEHEAALDQRLQREALDERSGVERQLPCS